MSDGGDIEVENTVVSDVLPKDVVKEVGNIKLFNKWDYDVEVRDISLTYVTIPHGFFFRGCKEWILGSMEEFNADGFYLRTVTTFPCETPSMSPTLLADMPSSDSARPTALSLSD